MPELLSAHLKGRTRHHVRITAWFFAVAVLVTRLPFAASRLWDHDSVQFALGVERFDLAAHHPHPPGYPLYIAVLKLFAAAGIEPLVGMVALSMLATSLGAFAAVLLGADLCRATTGTPPTPWKPIWSGAFFAALFAFNPLVWFYSELPLIYAVEGGLSLAVGFSVVRMTRSRRAYLPACALFAAVGGLRPSTMILLAPLFLWGVWHAWRGKLLSGRRLASGGVVLASVVLAWTLPLWLAAGGVARYREINAEHFATLLPRTSVLFGAGVGALGHNLEVLTKWTLQAVVPGTAVVLVLGPLARRNVRPALRNVWSALPLILVWLLLPVSFFALFHITKAGYTLIHLPALLLALTLAATPTIGSVRRGLTALGLVALLGGALFVFGTGRSASQPRILALVLQEFNRTRIREFERELDQIRDIAAGFSPTGTVLVTVELAGRGGAASEGFLYPWHRHLQWYLPAYPVRLLVPDSGFALTTQGHEPLQRVGRKVRVPAETTRLLFILAGPTGERFPLPPGRVLFSGRSFYAVEIRSTPPASLGDFRLAAAGEGRNGERRPSPPSRSSDRRSSAVPRDSP